jgi:hypothetical protein
MNAGVVAFGRVDITINSASSAYNVVSVHLHGTAAADFILIAIVASAQ